MLRPSNAVLSITLITTALCSSNALANCADWMKHEVKALHSSKTLNLCEVMGNKPVLIVNTASACGFTGQFTGLEGLHYQYKDQGLTIVGFPSPSFNQEYKDAAKTAEVCYKNYGVTFAMTESVPVKGNNSHPIFKHLGEQAGSPNWNFNKYLVNAKGEVVKRFGSMTKPDSEELASAIEGVL